MTLGTLLSGLEIRKTKLLKLGEILVLPSQNEDFSDWSAMVEGVHSAVTTGDHHETLRLNNLNRKWEVVSAYQKSVRRGNTLLAENLISAMFSVPAERQYMIRRVCTVAAEDIGAGNPLLMKFVLAVSSVYTPSTLDNQQTRSLWQYLTRLLCESPKSRLYCQLSIMGEAIKNPERHYRLFDSGLGAAVRDVSRTDQSRSAINCTGWLAGAQWRAEGMALGPAWHQMLPEVARPLTLSSICFNAPTMLSALPEYCYDKHTQLGQQVIAKLCWTSDAKALFKQYPPVSKKDLLGWAMFFEEGGLIKDELKQTAISALEQRLAAERHGIPADGWLEARAIMAKLLDNGVVHDFRVEALKQRCYCYRCIDPHTQAEECSISSMCGIL